MTPSVDRLSLATAAAGWRRLGTQRWDHGQRPEAAALRPGALQVLLAVSLQSLQPQDEHEEVCPP